MKQRPNPEKLLQRAHEEEQKEKRGKLKIYLGAAPGVGKTYTMLQDAINKHQQGLDVVVGIVETHGRQEIVALVENLPLISRQAVPYHDQVLEEFDLEAVLKRNPGLVLIDEMAHTNALGLRHVKRWQDIKEILDRGIDVYTTLNVQHIDSLNDVVSQIIHTRIQETVPDFMLDLADTIELVDLPPEDLLKRLQEGKVYFPQQAELAEEHFFRKGNLIALREIALRATAERVSAEVLLYRQGQGIRYIWPTRDKILVCVGPGNGSTKLIRAACRMANKLQAEWIAVHVDSARMPLSSEEKSHAIQNLRLAEQLGAETRVLPGIDVLTEILNFSHEHNITLLMVWKQIRSRLRDFIFGNLADEITRRSGEIDVYVVTNELDEVNLSVPVASKTTRDPFPAWQAYALSIGVVILTTLINWVIYSYVGDSNIIMVYLFGVAMVALMGRSGPSFLASILSVAAYGFLFTAPHFTFAITSFKYLLTLIVMLIVTQVISHLTIITRRQTAAARQAEHHTAALHMLSRQLASTRGMDKLLDIAVRYLGEIFDCGVLAILPQDHLLSVRAAYKIEHTLNAKEEGVAQWVYDLGQMAGLGTDTLPYSDALYVPLQASQGTLGVLRVRPLQTKAAFSSEQMRLLEACANQLAVAIEVDCLQEHTSRTALQTEADRARGLLLQNVSHHLRTPLVSVLAATSTLMEMSNTLNKKAIKKLSSDIYVELEQLSRLINNLLQITYLESESIKLEIEPHALAETITAAIQAESKKLGKKPIDVLLPATLPAIPFDKTLLQAVLESLLDNAIKFTPPDSAITIAARLEGNQCIVSVADNGPGIFPDEVNLLFEKFYRGRLLTTERGLGLGLAICHSVIKAHGGNIWAENRPGGGAVFCFTLPLPA